MIKLMLLFSNSSLLRKLELNKNKNHLIKTSLKTMLSAHTTVLVNYATT